MRAVLSARQGCRPADGVAFPECGPAHSVEHLAAHHSYKERLCGNVTVRLRES